MTAIAFATIKGGVGKTTLAAHTAAALADAGKSVLFLDLDPQAHASMVLGLDGADKPCLGDVFGPRPKYSLEEVVVPSARRPNLRIAPAALRMAAMERELYHWGHRLTGIHRALKTLSWVPDVVVCDTPPSIGAYTEAVMHFVDVLAAPVPTGAFALQGLGEIERAWQDVREGGGQLTVVVNMWDRRTSATNDAMEEALAGLTTPVASARIPRSEAINQAGLAYELVFDHSASAMGVEELRAVAKELYRLAQKRRGPKGDRARAESAA
jgi:chromosome partitioning protein